MSRNTYKEKAWTSEMVCASSIQDLIGRKVTYMLGELSYRGYVTGATTKDGLVYVMIDSKWLPNGNGPVWVDLVSERVIENQLQPLTKAARERYRKTQDRW